MILSCGFDMAPLTTHLVIGERVFAQLKQFEAADYGAFLLGCVILLIRP